jgi:hypothetical protein
VTVRDALARLRGHAAFALPVALEAAAGAAWLASQRTAAVAILAAGAAWQAVASVRSRGRRPFLFHAVAFTVFATLAAGAVGGPRAATFLLPAGLACLLVGLGIAHRTAVRDFAAHTLPRWKAQAEEPVTTWLRDRAAIALSLQTVVLALLLAPVAAWRFSSGSPDAAPPPPDEAPRGAPGENAAPPSSGRPPDTTPRPGQLSFPPNAHGSAVPGDLDDLDDASLSPSRHTRRPDSWRDRRVVMEVHPSFDGAKSGHVGPIYLRGLPVAQSEYRWRIDVPPTRSIGDADDGRADGWCELAVRPPAEDRLDLAVHVESPDAAPDGDVVVFCPPGTAAVKLPRLRVEPGGLVLAERRAASETFDYDLVALKPSRVPFPGPIARVVGRESAAHPPAASDVAAARLGVLAQQAVTNVSSPVDRIRAVVRYLRDHYGYDESGASLDDPAALARLLAARAGSCTQFAQAGVVMLRAIGIPARVGTGFLACEWSAKKDAYVVRARDSHAWVEVAFEGCGWVIFDPTPREPPGAEDGRPDPDADGDPPAPGPPPSEGGGSSVVGVSDDVGEMVDDVDGTLSRIWRFVCDNPWPFLAAAVLGAALAVRVARRRRRRLAGEVADVPVVRKPWDRLVAELGRRGHRRRPSQTASEFAASVVESAGEAFTPLLALTARHEAARFGCRPLTAEDERAIDAFRAAIRRSVPPAS